MKKLKVLITAVALIISLFLLVSPLLIAYAQSAMVRIEDNFPTAMEVLKEDTEIIEEELSEIPTVSAGIATVLDAEYDEEEFSTETEKIEEETVTASTYSREVVQSPKKESLGKFKLTAYCSCEKCCGEWSKFNKTASGTTPKEGRTVACNSLLFGTKLLIDGEEYIVEDTGNMSDNVIDIYFYSHEEALQFGVQSTEVFEILN